MATPRIKSKAFEKALGDFRDSFRDRLTVDQQLSFCSLSLYGLKQSVAQIQRTQSTEKKLKNLKRLKCFLEAMQSFEKVIDAFLNASEYVGFIWGPVKLLLQVSANHVEAFDALLDTYFLIGNTIPLLEEYEDLFKASTYLQVALVHIYGIILEFHLKAMKCFETNVWHKMFRALWKTFRTRFDPYLQGLRDNIALIQQHASVQHFRDFQNSFHEQKRRFKDQATAEDRQRCQIVNGWLSNGSIAKEDQEAHSSRRRHDLSSGLWLLQKDEIRNWLDRGAYQSPIVWMNGPPGAGKTVLTSCVVEECQQRYAQDPEAAIAYFYCKHGDASRDNFFAMARSLVWQLFRQRANLLPWLYEVSVESGQATLNTDEELCRMLVTHALKSVNKMYVIVDGLDECTEVEHKKVIKFFHTLIGQLSDNKRERLHCLLVGQNDDVSVKLLSNRTTVRSLTVTEFDNKKDIFTFCTRMSIKIRDKFDLNDVTCRELAANVSGHAKGMFLYAKLVMKNLKQQLTLEDLQSEIDRDLPRGIDEAYNRIIQRVIDNAPERGKNVQKILSIIALAVRPLKWREIQGALAVDPESRSVDVRSRQVREDPKKLCSSLIEKRANGDVELVHKTAKDYLIQWGNIDVQQAQLSIADVCLALLTGKGFDVKLPDDESVITKCLGQGFYSFAFYAVAYWASHVTQYLKGGVDPEGLTIIGENLQSFLQHHYRQQKAPVERAAVSVDLLPWAQAHEIAHAMNSTNKQLTAAGPESAENDALDLPEKFAYVRTVMEHSSQISAKTLTNYYGQLFKCPRMSCVYFYSGFSEAARRDAHVAHHEKPYRCSYPNCRNAIYGYGTRRELRHHLTTMHNERDWDDDAIFPSGKRIRILDDDDDEDHDLDPQGPKFRSSNTCSICDKKFTRRLILNDHVKAHQGEKPYECEICGLAFTRKNDKNRHERDLHGDVKKFVCTGKLGKQLYDGDTWGCGKAFKRGHKLSQHYVWDDADEGHEACIEKLVRQVRLGPKQYRCYGILENSHGGEPTKWGCDNTFRTSKTLKKHWKSRKGRLHCLAIILKGKETPPPSPETSAPATARLSPPAIRYPKLSSPGHDPLLSEDPLTSVEYPWLNPLDSSVHSDPNLFDLTVGVER